MARRRPPARALCARLRQTLAPDSDIHNARNCNNLAELRKEKEGRGDAPKVLYLWRDGEGICMGNRRAAATCACRDTRERAPARLRGDVRAKFYAFATIDVTD
ncbi:hypothetical protein EVAR_63359_1 [Eumeta japonica]|uniref:Uncharacterized protein n=1 Tax=Eumeta variegata TaxID=151549 RepID=A0A4C2ADV2_EUMVA|nr:hypothetical protein EVAR_63359_1 [Eumeta japonica]